MLKIEIRKHQQKDKQGINVVVSCNNGIATYISGTEDPKWYDITKDVSGLDSLQITEEYITGEKNNEKAATTSITIGFDAYNLVYDYLLSTDCGFLNYFDVKITDTDLNYQFNLYELKPSNIELCDDNGCSMSVPLREVDEYKSITDKISIHDNWQGWFGGGEKDFPCMQVFTHFISTQKGITLGALAVISNYYYLINFLQENGVDLFPFDLNKTINKAYGFGRFLPTPYVRDILENAMQKVGYTLDTPFDFGRECANDVYVWSEGYYYENWEDDPVSPSGKFIYENRKIQKVTDFLNDICLLYNFTWKIEGTKLKIVPNKDIDNSDPIFEISEDDVISDCKLFSFEKNKSAGKYTYKQDPSDNATKEVINEYNDFVDYDGVTNNALLTGSIDKEVNFAPTSFWGDEFGENIGESISDMAKIILLLVLLQLALMAVGLLAGVFSATGAIPIFGAAILLGVLGIIFLNDLQSSSKFGLRSYYEFSIKHIGTGAMNVPRIVRVDPNSPDDYKHPVSILSSSISINPKYNTENIAWHNQFNATPEKAYNYPLFFDANFFGNLYDTYHEKTDNSLFVQQSNEYRNISVLLCQNYLQLSKLNESESIIGKIILYKGILYKVIKIEVNYSELIINFELKKIKNETN
jgi:hypothetical protein